MNNNIPLDTVISRMNSGQYYQYSSSYERGVIGNVYIRPNSLIVDSTSNVDTVFAYARFYVDINYNYCAQQLAADKAANPNLAISFVDTPTHVMFNSTNRFFFTGYVNIHTEVFPYSPMPIMKVKFIDNNGRMESEEDAVIRIACAKKSTVGMSYQKFGELSFDKINWNLNYNGISPRCWGLTSINVNRGGYTGINKWQSI